MILRNFLYLDVEVVNEYLSQIDGSLVEGFSEDNTKDLTKDFKMDTKILGGSATENESSGLSKHHIVTSQARFKHLYDFLKDNEQIQELDAFDEEIWASIRKNEILEIEADIVLPKLLSMMGAIGEVNNLVDTMDGLKKLGQLKQMDASTFDEQKKMLALMSDFAEQINSQPIPVSFEAISTPGFSFIMELDRQFFKTNPEGLQGEVTVFGKVTRIIPSGRREILSPLGRNFPSLLVNNNKSIQEQKETFAQNGLGEIVDGPALKLKVVAIYN